MFYSLNELEKMNESEINKILIGQNIDPQEAVRIVDTAFKKSIELCGGDNE